MAQKEIQLSKEILEKIKNYTICFPEKSVFLFGSRVQGKASPRSDIDIGILAGKDISSTQMAKLEDFLNDLPVFQKFEVVDFEDVSPEFRKQALRYTYFLN